MKNKLNRAKRAVLASFLILGIASLISGVAFQILDFGFSISDSKPESPANKPDISTPRIPVPASSQPLSTPAVRKPNEAVQARVIETYGKLPLHFEPNHGQTTEQVKFFARGKGYALFLTTTEAVVVLSKREQEVESAIPVRLNPESKIKNSEITNPKSAVVRMKLVGVDPDAKIVGLQDLPGKSNYFIGNDLKNWRVNVPHYAKVKYEEIYPGIDLVFYGNQRQLEFDFVVAPSADPNLIQVAFEGADKIEMGDEGHLVLHTAIGQVQLRKPVVYQIVDGVRQEIPGAYVFNPDCPLAAGDQCRNNWRSGGIGPEANGQSGFNPKSKIENPKFESVGFQIAAYDPNRPLIIDPVLAYSTYIGGSHNDFGLGIAVDSGGHAYVMGVTASTDFPLQNPMQPDISNIFFGFDIFVAKLNPAGSALVYSTYLGGDGDDGTSEDFVRRGIAVDSEGNAYVTNFTTSTDFPTTEGALQTTIGGAPDAFVTKLNPAGNALVYSTYLGGSGSDEGRGIAVDSLGHAYVAGATTSTDFPITLGAFQTFNASGSTPGFEGDAFVVKLNPDGSDLVYSSYLGGSTSDGGIGITVDTSGNVYVTGSTNSSDFPTTPEAFEPNFPSGGFDAFVAKVNPDGSALVYSTYLGGSSDDVGSGIAVDASNNAYVTGVTGSTNFPTTEGAFQTTLGDCPGCRDAFVAKLNADGSTLVYSTYLGGSADDGGSDIAVDTSGNAYVTGTTRSTNFPTANAVQPNFGGAGYDAFVVKLNSGGALVYSTYLGGDSFDLGFGIAVDPFGNAYVTGRTNSWFGFPITPGAFQPCLDQPSQVNCFGKPLFDAFVTKIGEPVVVGPLTMGIFALPQGEVNMAYNANLEVGGGIPPYTLSIIKGSLPPGLDFGSPSITGTPTLSGRTRITMEVMDQLGSSISRKFKIKIFKLLRISTESLKAGLVGKAYKATLKAKGGKKPFTWSLISGSLPGGLSLDPATGKITGIPTEAGSFNLTFQVTDPLGGATQRIFALAIN